MMNRDRDRMLAGLTVLLAVGMLAAAAHEQSLAVTLLGFGVVVSAVARLIFDR